MRILHFCVVRWRPAGGGVARSSLYASLPCHILQNRLRKMPGRRRVSHLYILQILEHRMISRDATDRIFFSFLDWIISMISGTLQPHNIQCTICNKYPIEWFIFKRGDHHDEAELACRRGPQQMSDVVRYLLDTLLSSHGIAVDCRRRRHLLLPFDR